MTWRPDGAGSLSIGVSPAKIRRHVGANRQRGREIFSSGEIARRRQAPRASIDAGA